MHYLQPKQTMKEEKMFRYLEKHSWWVTLDEKEAPTIEALMKLCRAGEVERVIIPMTYYGYGASLLDESNRRSIKRHYRRAGFTDRQYNLTMSARQFLRNADYREFIEQLQESYPVFDEQDFSELETETKFEHLVGEVETALDREDATHPATGEAWTKAQIEEALNAGDWQDNIAWWEHVEIDSDGATPYATEEDVLAVAEMVKVKAREMEEAREREEFRAAGNVELPGL